MVRRERTAFILVFLLSACAHARVKPPADLTRSYRPGPFTLQRSLDEIDTLRVGDHPKSVYVSPDHRQVYVCNLEQGTVDILDAADGARLRQIRFPRTPATVQLHGKSTPSFEEKPVEIGFTGHGRYVWISLLNAGGVVVYDTRGARPPRDADTRMAEIRDVAGSRPRSVAMRFFPTSTQPKIIAVPPDEKWVFVANWKGNSITVIDPKKFEKVKDIEVGTLPRGICFTPSRAYVANFGSHTISEIDLTTLTRTRTFRNVGSNPRHLVTSPAGDTLYLSDHGSGCVREIDTRSGQTLRQCQVGAEPRTIALSSRGNFLFVSNYHDDTLTVIDLSTMKEAMRVPTVRRPIGVSVDPTTDTVWVTSYWDRVVRRYRFSSRLAKVAPLPSTYRTARLSLR